MRLAFDVETDNLLDEATKTHCIVAGDMDSDQTWSVGPTELNKGILQLGFANELIGHNIIDFDLPVLKKLEGFKPDEDVKITDTLTCARVVWPNIAESDYERKGFPPRLIGSHSLEAWGHRLGILKGMFGKETDWAEWTPEMQEYCEQDVEVTKALMRAIEAQNPSPECIELEHDFLRAILAQNRRGFCFDVEKAEALEAKLSIRYAEIKEELQTTFPPAEIQLKTKVKYLPFNINSRDQIAERLVEKGWKPKERTETGRVKVNETILAEIDIPEAQLISEALTIQKRLGMLSQGKNAWLKLVTSKGRLHGYVNTNGAVTGRCTHSRPNLAQVPAVRAAYGKECRELFRATPGYLLVGSDASGLELRCLAHFLGRHDGGEYARKILEEDIHTANQIAAGLETRDQAKTFIYALIYGAGDAKLGSIVGGTAKDGKAMRARFLNAIPGFKELVEGVQTAVKRHGYLRGLDGRVLPIRSPHSALNTLLQSAGAVLMKKATVLWADATRDWDCYLVGHIHDEIQAEARPDIADKVGQAFVDSLVKAGEHFNFRCPITGEYEIAENWAGTH